MTDNIKFSYGKIKNLTSVFNKENELRIFLDYKPEF